MSLDHRDQLLHRNILVYGRVFGVFRLLKSVNLKCRPLIRLVKEKRHCGHV